MKCRRAFGRVSAIRLSVVSLTVGAVFCGSIWPQSATAADQSARPAAAAPNKAEQTLRDAMRQIDCASLGIRTAPDGARVVSGTVPSDAERTRLVELEGRLAGREQLVIDVEILPPPLCRSLLAIDHMPSAVLAADAGMEARLEGGGSTLREGDPIRVEVTAGGHPVYLRIDYFSLDGLVLHMLPNSDQPVVTLAAGARRVFGASGGVGDAWNSGGAPFGTEFIAVTATPLGLDLGLRPDTELAASYLRDLEAALLRDHQAGGRAHVVATILLHTGEREQIAAKEPPPAPQEPPAAEPKPVPAVADRVVDQPTPTAASSTDGNRSEPPSALPDPSGDAAPLPNLRSRSLDFVIILLAALIIMGMVRRRRETTALAGSGGATTARAGLFRRATGERSGNIDNFVRSASAETRIESFMRWAGGNRVTLAIVFTDVVGSTALGESLKDQRMGALRTAHFAQSSKLIAGHDGHEIKTIGDSVMVAFRTVDNALDYACALHRDPGGAELPGSAELRIRAGIHIGPVSVEKGDVFGRTVNFAARVIGAITGSEIWVSEQAKADIDALGAGRHQDLQWQRHEDIEVKGFTGEITLWSLVIDQESVSEPAEMDGSAG